MEDIDEPLEDDEIVDDDDDLEDAEPSEEALAKEAPAVPADPNEDVESIQDLLVKQEARAGEDEAEDDDDTVVATTRDERLEPLEAKVVPIQTTEFICRNCYLVKHRSQLKDKKKMLCRDCA